MTENSGVLILGELAERKVATITKELLGVGRRLAGELNDKLSALIVGSGIRDSSEEAIAYGADNVYLVDDPLLSEYHPDSYTAVITEACQQVRPSIVLLGHTDIGREVAPRIAARLKCFAGMDCVGLSVDQDSKLLVQTRPVYGGNAMAVLVAEGCSPQLATVRPRAMAPLEPDSSRKGRIIDLKVKIDSSVLKAKLLATVNQETEGIKLEDAEVIVAGGGGIGGAEGFDLLRELAKVLRGAVGATRVPCDEGWVPDNLEIGQTGKIVKPNLYIAVGISGASQHLAGVLESKYVVAINNNPDANIFTVSNLGVVADYREAVPALIKECRENLTG